MKQLGVFLLPPGWDASPLKGEGGVFLESSGILWRTILFLTWGLLIA